MDYHWNDNKEQQIEWFEKQMDIAREAELPIIIHSRDAANDTYEVMKANKADEIGGIATPLALFLWIIFAVVCCCSRVIFGKLMDKDFAGNRLCSQKFASYNRKNSSFICAAWLYLCKVWAEFFLVHISGN